MIRSMLVAFVVLVFFQCASSKPANAQVGNNCWTWVSCGAYDLWNTVCVPTLPATAFNCEGIPFEWAVECMVMTSSCAPAAGPSENCGCGGRSSGSGGGNGSGDGKGSGGAPISFSSGDTWITETDIRIPGLGGGLSLDRTWNSLWPSTQTAYQLGLFGPNWRSTFEERIFVGADHYAKYARSDGSFWSFGYSDGVFKVAAPANVSATLVQNATNWVLTFESGEQRVFDGTTGALTAIIDRNGNTTQLTYDASKRLTTVTDPVSRHLYFNYNGSGALVASVTTDFGVTVSYSYDGQGRLSQVTEPDGSTLNFQYDSNSFISAVLDSQGKILESHTYDSSGRGLTSSRANGVEAVTVSYQ